MRRWVSLVLTCATLMCAIGAGAAHAQVDRVRTDVGRIEGLGPQESGVRIFLGVPYARPPVGDLRWREPQELRRWRDVRETKQFAPRCMQRRIYDDMIFRSPAVSEDCLYLNIWTPANTRGARNARLPVLLYFHGGGFTAGDGSELRYDGEALAARGIVVITINYRMGAFGFMAHPELTAESEHDASGNYGLLDQVAALNWVKANIRNFGGDPDRILVAGESAGSFSAHAMAASPLSRDLIAGAIGQSGAMMGPMRTRAEAETDMLAYAEAHAKPALADLRAMSSEELLAWSTGDGAPRFFPIVDGYVFPKSPAEIYAAGEQADVPLLVGSNSEEGSAQWVLRGASPSIQNFRNLLAESFGERANDVFAHYHAESDGAPVLDAAQALASDNFIALDTWAWIDAATRTGEAQTFYYYFTRPRPAPIAGWNANRPRGAVHSAEIEYALGNLATNEVYDWSADDYAISELMQRYFANFIKTGDPNGEGLPPWYNFESGWRQTIDVETRAEADHVRARYEFMLSLREQMARAPR